MEQIATDVVLQVAAAVLSLVVSVVVTYVGIAAKRVLDSKQTREWSEALRNFDEDLYASLEDLGAAVEEKIRDEATSFTRSDRYDMVTDAILEKANSFSKKTGVNAEFSEEHLDALVRAAMREGRDAWERSYGSART